MSEPWWRSPYWKKAGDGTKLAGRRRLDWRRKGGECVRGLENLEIPIPDKRSSGLRSSRKRGNVKHYKTIRRKTRIYSNPSFPLNKQIRTTSRSQEKQTLRQRAKKPVDRIDPGWWSTRSHTWSCGEIFSVSGEGGNICHHVERSSP